MSDSEVEATELALDSINVAILPKNKDCREKKYSVLHTNNSDPYVESALRQGDSTDSRRGARRDHDKIYYTSAWRRLAGVTQVISPDGEESPLHTRLTHSEKVALTAWSIGSNLINAQNEEIKHRIANHGGLDLDMVATAALAHDLGHPPFGHVGETELDSWGATHGLEDGFEGNAQTFRILTRLARWHPHYPGLKLRLGTLSAVLKYPWTRGSNLDIAPLPSSEKIDLFIEEINRRREKSKKDAQLYRYWTKYGAYFSEAPLLELARSWMPQAFRDGNLQHTQSCEASVMDCADDIAYAVHDFEDFATSGLMDIKQLTHEYKTWDENHNSPNPEPLRNSWYDTTRERLAAKNPEYFKKKDYDSAVEWLQVQLRVIEEKSTAASRPTLEYQEAKRTSGFLSGFVTSDCFEVLESPATEWPDGPLVKMKSKTWHRVNLLKAVTMDFVVATPTVAAHQRSARRIIRELATELYDWASTEADCLPYELGAALTALKEGGRRRTESEIARCVIDYLCSLSDHAVQSLTMRLHGPSTGALVRKLL